MEESTDSVWHQPLFALVFVKLASYSPQTSTKTFSIPHPTRYDSHNPTASTRKHQP